MPEPRQVLVRRGAHTKFNRGFRSKAEVDAWFERLREGALVPRSSERTAKRLALMTVDWPPPHFKAAIERWFAQLEADGMVAKTSTGRVSALRARRQKQDLKRLELYVTDEEAEKLKAELAKMRAKTKAPRRP